MLTLLDPRFASLPARPWEGLAFRMESGGAGGGAPAGGAAAPPGVEPTPAAPAGDPAAPTPAAPAELDLTGLPDDVATQVRERLSATDALSGVEGLSDIPAEDLSKLVGLHSIMSDQDAFGEWWNAIGEELDLFEDDTNPTGDPAAPAGDPADPAKPADPAAVGEHQPVVDAVMSALGPRLEAIEGRFKEQDDRTAKEEGARAVRTALDEVKGEHEKSYGQGSWTTADTAEKDAPNVEDAVLQLALRYTGQPDAVKRGYQDYVKLVGNAENGLLTRKAGEPDPAVAGGPAATAPEEIKTFEQASAAALKQLQADRGA